MISGLQIAALIFIALIGHAMALFWYFADKRRLKLCQKTIYDMPIGREQIRRELQNSMHTPLHAIMLYGCLLLGCFQNTTLASFAFTLVLTFIWAEIWHYLSHRAFHIKQLHWIHAEHHRSHLNSPFTALSFSFTEKLVFNLGILGMLALIDRLASLNFYAVATWYAGYLLINSFSHANFEIKSEGFQRAAGKVLTSTTYHALHHSRYTNNYGLGTRLLDKLFGTEWEDYERLFDRVTLKRAPLRHLRQRVNPTASSD